MTKLRRAQLLVADRALIGCCVYSAPRHARDVIVMHGGGGGGGGGDMAEVDMAEVDMAEVAMAGVDTEVAEI